MQYGFYFDNTRCTGCKTCELACKDYKDLDADTAYRIIYDYEGGAFTKNSDTFTLDVFAYHVSVSCNHCAAPACIPACPMGAITKDVDTGLVSIDPEYCDGCGSCVEACPYHAPKLVAAVNKAEKCDGCAARVAASLQPICVESCPIRALQFGDLSALQAQYGDAASLAPLADPSITGPSLVIKSSPAAKPFADTTGFIANPAESFAA